MPRRMHSRSRLVGALLLLALSAAPAGAQETRGAITGTISDKSAAVLPGVTVNGTNVETGVVTSAVSNAQGIYLLPFLPPGKYTVSAELMGFKKHVREGIEIRIADRLTLDLALEVGQLEEVISVRAESPLLDTRSASQGQVIDERRIALLPLSDGNAFTLARLAPGIAYTGDLKFSRAFDNGGTSGIVSDGASGGNEFTLDGTPNMANGRRVAFVPPAGAVSEFKVETASFDAQQGHTAGATVNVAIKSGTNNLKGEGYWYYRDDKLSKNDFFLETAGRPKAAMSYDRFGGFAGGPILKNRTFFFGAVEWLYDEFPEPDQFTVPTEKMRNGDFSELLASGITIYDPATAVRRADGRIERQPFPGNIIPANRISPIARNYLQYLAAAQPGRRHAAAEQLLEQQPAVGRLLFDLAARRSSAERSPEPVRPLHPQRSARIARQLGRRGERHPADRQLPLSRQRRRHRRPRLDHHAAGAAERPRRLAALPGAERPPARRHLRPGVARLPGIDGGAVRSVAIPAALRHQRHVSDR